MFNKRLCSEKIIVLLMLSGSTAASNGCRSKLPALETLNTDELKWVTYSSEKLGYSISYPTVLTPESSEDGEVLFRYGWGVTARVRFIDETQGKKSGAWFGNEPMEKIKLDG